MRSRLVSVAMVFLVAAAFSNLCASFEPERIPEAAFTPVQIATAPFSIVPMGGTFYRTTETGGVLSLRMLINNMSTADVIHYVEFEGVGLGQKGNIIGTFGLGFALEQHPIKPNSPGSHYFTRSIKTTFGIAAGDRFFLIPVSAQVGTTQWDIDQTALRGFVESLSCGTEPAKSNNLVGAFAALGVLNAPADDDTCSPRCEAICFSHEASCDAFCHLRDCYPNYSCSCECCAQNPKWVCTYSWSCGCMMCKQ